ncbi:hypothetical protein LCGC14_2105580, partial [marine sediment metagenome]
MDDDNGQEAPVQTQEAVALTEALTPTDALKELGSAGPRRHGGIIAEEFLVELQGVSGARTYAEMSRNDPIIGAILFGIETVFRSVDWFTVPGGETEPDKKASDFLNTCMDDMSHTWTALFDNILSMVPYGYAPFE